MEETIKQICYR